MSLALFAPPAGLKQADRLALGQSVRYTHKAVVVRWWWKDREHKEQGSEWVPREGLDRNGPLPWLSHGERPQENDGGIAEGPWSLSFGSPSSDPFWERRLPYAGGQHLTKTVFVWPSEGEGVITGLIRRGIGHADAGYMSHNYEYGPEYEPGWFNVANWAWLYVIRHRLEGRDYILVPTWATNGVAADAGT